MQTALWALQEAIYAKLSAHTGLAGMIGDRIYDNVSNEDVAYPYVVIGEPLADPLETKTTAGEEIAVVLNVWSTYLGKQETIAIINACLDALKGAMTVEGFRLLKVKVDGTQVFDDTDTTRRHGVLRMRYWVNNK